MHDETINVILLFFMFMVFMSFVRGRRSHRRQRDLEERLDRLHAEPRGTTSAPALPTPSREQFERLEDRVRVLERIVTDRGYNLAAEIEALRDQRPVSAATDDSGKSPGALRIGEKENAQ